MNAFVAVGMEENTSFPSLQFTYPDVWDAYVRPYYTCYLYYIQFSEYTENPSAEVIESQGRLSMTLAARCLLFEANKDYFTQMPKKYKFLKCRSENQVRWNILYFLYLFIH